MNKRCQKCGSGLAAFPGICPSCGAVNADTPASGDRSRYVRPGESVLLHYPLAKPWPRFFARTFDLWIESGLFFALFLLYTFFINPQPFSYISKNSLVFGAVFFLVVFLFDTIIHSIFRNTPGKAMLGLKVGDMHGNRLGFLNYLKRNGYVLLMGYWMGFPVLGGPMIHQWLRMRKGKQTTYDEIMGTRVWAKPIGLARKSVFACLVMSIFGLIIVVVVKNTNERNSYAGNSAKTFLWTNPVSDKKIHVTENWKVETKVNREGQTYWRFVNSTGRAIEVLGVENAPGRTIGDYADDYINVLGRTAQIDSGGDISIDHGIRVWKGAGHVNGKNYLIVQLVIAQKGDEFWRIVIIRAIPKDQVWSDSASLEHKLLSTIY